MIPQECIAARNEHHRCIDELERAFVDLAEAQMQVDVLVGQLTAAYQAVKKPAATISALVKGDRDVAEANRQVAVLKGVCKAADARVQATYLDWKEAINAYEREWRMQGYDERYNVAH